MGNNTRNPREDLMNMVVLYGAPPNRPWDTQTFTPEAPVDLFSDQSKAEAKRQIMELMKYTRALRVAKTTKQELTVGLDEICNKLTEILATL